MSSEIADAVHVGTRWLVSGAWVVGSGRPETPAQGVEAVWFPSGDSVYQVKFGPKNSGRLPPYHRLDVSSSARFRFHAFTSTAGVTVFNVYNRKNIWYRDYETTGTTLTTTDVTLMGRAVNVWLRFGF